MKDYYRILGVVADAEDIVVRAAYKALAQRYHPDKWVGDRAEANRRMAEINEAYAVLCDSVKRQQYDSGRDRSPYQEEPDETEKLLLDIKSDWQKVEEYFPVVIDLVERLAKISKGLEYEFKVILLESRKFQESENLANKIEKSFLSKYFGTNPMILAFAKRLILGGNRLAAKELNETVNVLGTSVAPGIIVKRICDKFKIATTEFLNQKEIASKFLRSSAFSDAIEMIELLGGSVLRKETAGNPTYEINWQREKIELSDFELHKFAVNIASEVMRESP